MKHLIILILAIVLNINAFAQTFECGFALGEGPINHNEKRTAIEMSMHAGVKRDYSFSFGGYYTLFLTNSKEDTRFEDFFDDYKFRYRGIYAGFYVEKCVFQRAFFSVNIGTKLGFGGINYGNDSENYDEDDEYYENNATYDKLDQSFVMALEPYISADFAISDDLSLSAVTEYRTLNCMHLNYNNCNIASGSSLNGCTYFLKLTVYFD
ncbi:MAG: hypothetical protein IKQ46_13745 [Bacteroidales bacterium]|nr:hypothetical protein [Bacteroidales bacterium]